MALDMMDQNTDQPVADNADNTPHITIRKSKSASQRLLDLLPDEEPATAPAAAQPTNGSASQRLLALLPDEESNAPAAQASAPAAPSTQINKSALDRAMKLTSGPKAIGQIELKQKDPEAFAALNQQAINRASEVGTGLGDYPRSIARAVAAVSPTAYNAIASGPLGRMAGNITGDQIPQTANDLQKATEQRNAEFQQKYGQDPGAAYARFAGSAIPAAVGGGIIGKGVGMAAEAAGNAMPALEPTLNFLGGGYESNAVINPLTGALEKGATVGNKLMQYLSSGANAAAQAIPVTAQMNASSNEPVAKQLGQNAVVGGGLGMAGPAAVDLGIGMANKSNAITAPKEDLSLQNAQNAFHNLMGGPVDVSKGDFTEYVPGAKPTMAQALGSDPNAAALERTLAEANPTKGGTLVNSALKEHYDAQDAARKNFLEQVVGTPEDLSQAYKDRASQAQKLLYGDKDSGTPAIWDAPGTKPVNVQPILDKIDDTLTGNKSGQEATVKVFQAIKNKLTNNGETPTILSENPEYMYRSVVKSINNWLENNNTTELGALAKEAKPELLALKNEINTQIKTAVPGYDNYLKSFADMSKPIDQMETLQGHNWLSSKDEAGVPTLAKVNNALDKITKARNEPSGIVNEEKSLTDDQINKLQRLQSSLMQKEAPKRALASITQNSATDPKGVMRDKLQKELGNYQQAGVFTPRHIGSTVGATAGGGIGSLIPVPGATTGGMLTGGWAGEQIGNLIERASGSAANQTKDRLMQMFLNPDNYSAVKVPTVNFLKSVGEQPEIRGTLNALAPYGAIEGTRAIAGPRNVSGAYAPKTTK